MFEKQTSQLSQPGLEVVIPKTPVPPPKSPEPPPKIFIQGPAVPGKDRSSSSTPLLGRGRGRGQTNLKPPVSAWSDSPTSEYGSLFPRSAYYRQSPWPAAAQDDSNRWPSSSGQYVKPERRTFAFLGRTKFWLVLGPVFLLLATGLAVGLGLGLGLGSGAAGGGEGGGDAAAGNNSSGDIAVESVGPTSVASRTVAYVAPSPTVSVLVLAPTPITCPDANGTVYQAYGKDPFQVLCDVTYNNNINSNNNGGGIGAVSTAADDAGSKDTESVEECMDACSENDDCVGAGWGKSQGKFTCWMKESLGASTEEQDWYFVIKHGL